MQIDTLRSFDTVQALRLSEKYRSEISFYLRKINFAEHVFSLRLPDRHFLAPLFFIISVKTLLNRVFADIIEEKKNM